MRPLTDDERQMVEENTGLVYHTVYAMVSKGALIREAVDDAISEGMIGLMKAAQYFDKERGLQFSTLASTCIRWEILGMVRRDIRERNHVCISLDDIVSKETASDAGVKCWKDAIACDADTEAEALDWLEDAVYQIMEEEGKLHYGELLVENAHGRTMEEIANERGVTKQRVSKQISEARKILRSKIELN